PEIGELEAVGVLGPAGELREVSLEVGDVLVAELDLPRVEVDLVREGDGDEVAGAPGVLARFDLDARAGGIATLGDLDADDVFGEVDGEDADAVAEPGEGRGGIGLEVEDAVADLVVHLGFAETLADGELL